MNDKLKEYVRQDAKELKGLLDSLDEVLDRCGKERVVDIHYHIEQLAISIIEGRAES